MRRSILVLSCLAGMLALFFTISSLPASAQSLTPHAAQSMHMVKVASCGDEWDAENDNSSLDVQIWTDTCTGKLYSVAYLLQRNSATVFLDVGGLGGGGYASNQRSLSQGQSLSAGEIYIGPSGAYACAALVGNGGSVCTSF